MIYYISDMHFEHNNVIRYDNRPFDTITQMDEILKIIGIHVFPTKIPCMFSAMHFSRAKNVALKYSVN